MSDPREPDLSPSPSTDESPQLAAGPPSGPGGASTAEALPDDEAGEPAGPAGEGASQRLTEDSKSEQLEPDRDRPAGAALTTDEGVRVSNTDDSLKAGLRGPTLLEDFHLREKVTHFDHERIPERVVHARGTAAHGYFQVYASMARYTRAKFLQDPAAKTPVFVRFSTVVGSRGSADTVRDVRGFATKFYTEEGNYDLVGNNIPIFFIQDGMKFPDLIHAVKPEPRDEIPQASSAHDTFYDFASLRQESTHMLLWALSDRALPRSYRMMEGFGVHTFRLVNARGQARFVKFHWKPLLGVHSLVWDETQKLAGKDPDFHRRDLYDAIKQGHFPEWELGMQIIEEADEHKFDFDLLDPTKLVPEEQVPVKRVGKMVLNRAPDNFFAEAEQVAFCTANVVPGIDFTNDPLLQARNFSYLDTQLLRLGGPNFKEIPINRPLAPVHNHQQDGWHRERIYTGEANYSPNSIENNDPHPVPPAQGGYAHYQEKVDGQKIRQRSPSFMEFYKQASLFYNSMSEHEKRHIIKAFRFELGKVKRLNIRQRVVEQINKVDSGLARAVAEGIGVPLPPNHGRASTESSPALSQERTVKDTIKSRRVAFLVEEGVSDAQLQAVQAALEAGGASVFLIARTDQPFKTDAGREVRPDMSLVTSESILFDAVYVPGGDKSVERLKTSPEAIHFLDEAYKHCKPMGATDDGVDLLTETDITGVKLSDPDKGSLVEDRGVVTQWDAARVADFAPAFVKAIAQHRFFARELGPLPPA